MKAFKDKVFLRRFFQVSFPVMVHAFIIFVVSFVDNLMVGAISNEAISGVYASNQATFIFMCTSLGVLSGGGIFIQQFFGAKDQEHMVQSFRFKLIAGTIYLIIVIPLYYLLGEKLLWFYCHNDANALAILQEGKAYLNIVVISYIPFVYASAYSTSLREVGKAKYSMLSGLAALVTNVIFNSIFIFGLHMGVKGAAIATVISRLVEFIVVCILGHVKHIEVFQGAYKHFRVDKDLYKTMSSKTFFMFLNEFFWVTSMVCLSLAYAQRDNVLSSLAVVSTMSDIFQIIFQGLSVGVGVLVGSALGSNNFEEAKDYSKKFYQLGLLIGVISSILLLALSPFIPLLFKEIDNEQRALASELIRIFATYLCFFVICSLNYSLLKTGGKAITTFLLDSLFQWVLYIPMAWCLVSFTNASLIWIYLSVQTADMVKAGIGYILIRKNTWVQNITLNKEKIAIEEKNTNN